MKRTIFFLVFGMLVLNVQAKIWRVNNITSINADFRTIQAAHDASTVLNGDSLYVEPSGVSYGDLSATKKLIIIGNGYFLNENVNNQVNVASSILGAVYFKTGSTGSQIIGLTINSISFKNEDVIDNILIERNNIKTNISFDVTALTGLPATSYVISNIIIKKNYIEGSITQPCTFTNCSVNANMRISTIVICNNYIGDITLSNAQNCSNSGVITNNIVPGGICACGMSIGNNILTNPNTGIYLSGKGSITQNNISVGQGKIGTDGQSINDKFNVALSTIFIGKTGNSTDGQWQLKSGSPAIGAGLSGIDCGIFGNSDPYVLSGLPPIPLIYEISAPTSGSATSGLAVKVKVKTQK